MGEEQRPWWTTPPTPSPHPPHPPAQPPAQAAAHPSDEVPTPAGGHYPRGSDGAPSAGGEPRAARFRARMRQLKETATGEMPLPSPRSTGTPGIPGAPGGEPSWPLPQFEPPSTPGGVPGPPAAHGAHGGPVAPPHPPQAPPVTPVVPQPAAHGDPMVVDLRDLDDPHDPLAGTWTAPQAPGAQQAPPPQAAAASDGVTLTPERYSTYPSGADGRPAAGDSTERLPRIGEIGPSHDALGVYGAPSQVAPGIPGISGDADPIDHLRDLPAGRRLPKPVEDLLARVPGGDKVATADSRTLVIGGGLAAVLVLVLIVAIVTGGGDPEPPPTAAVTGGSQAGAPGSADGFEKVGAAAAEKDLERVGEDAGDVVGAWRWNDKNGRNLLATTREKRGANQTLRVVHVARLDKTPKTLRVMTDPDLPGCRDGAAGFTKNSVQVRDLDKDSVAEVLVGWTSRCGGADAESTVKLALLSNGDKYILRGQGVVGNGGSQAPEPAAKDWPKAYLKAANTEFKKLYF